MNATTKEEYTRQLNIAIADAIQSFVSNHPSRGQYSVNEKVWYTIGRIDIAIDERVQTIAGQE
jgi:hypothetical protein